MNKSTLRRLGRLWKIKEELHNLWVDNGYDEDTAHKIKLVNKVKKQLEEQKRGFVSKRVPYSKMADFLILNYRTLPAIELHQAVSDIVLGRSDL